MSKILRYDKNNQNGYAMTKPLPTGCIKKQKKVPTWQKFNMLLERVIWNTKLVIYLWLISDLTGKRQHPSN